MEFKYVVRVADKDDHTDEIGNWGPFANEEAADEWIDRVMDTAPKQYFYQIEPIYPTNLGLPVSRGRVKTGMDEQDYTDAVNVARDLIGPEALAEGLDNEYTRGVVELVADLFGVPGVFLDDRKEQVLADLMKSED